MIRVTKVSYLHIKYAKNFCLFVCLFVTFHPMGTLGDSTFVELMEIKDFSVSFWKWVVAIVT